MKHLRLTLALAALALAPTLAKADPITYTFNQTYTQDANFYFTVKGTLTTDGVIGAVAAKDITGYDLFVTETTLFLGTASSELSLANTVVGGSGLSANASSLSFDFSGPNTFIVAGSGTLHYGPGGVDFSGIGIGGVSVAESGPTVIASVASAATPEPSSLLLLGTGALGLAGAARRRFVRA